ncbi:MAG TPA: DinB family protein [Gemmatimonadaceae bacterium]|jgi:Protein of unknown function (DUF664).
MSIPRPQASEYKQFYAGYVARLPDGDALDHLRTTLDDTIALIGAIPESRGDHRYAPGKWSIKEVVGHMTDTERVMVYRALRFARADATPLAAFDEGKYVPPAHFERRTLVQLLDEYRAVREATIAFVESLDDEQVARGGEASAHWVTVRALCWIIPGHNAHHLAILREKYL